MRKIKLTKISDDFFNGDHPNGINEGYVKQGWSEKKPVVGESFRVNNFYTSTIIEIIDDNTFKTLNSTYRWEILE